MKKQSLTFAALVIALSLSTDIEAFEKEFNHEGVIPKGLTYDDEANSTTFCYTDENGITKWYTIEGEIPSLESPASFSATVVVLNGDSEVDPFEKEFLHSGIIQKGISVDDAVGTTSFRYCDEKNIIKSYTITGEIPAVKAVKAEKPAAAKKAVAKKTISVKTATAKKALAKK